MKFAGLYYLLFMFARLINVTTCKPYQNAAVSPGSFLTAGEDNESFWSSPSGEFAFGFQETGDGFFLLAVWFNNIPEKTIIWSANRNIPVQEGSIARFTNYGWLELVHQKGKSVWNAHPSGRPADYAAMLDSGNFVLASEKSEYLWQSFDHPTDTLLPTQTFKQGSKLVAPFSATNHSSGRFFLTLQNDENLVLYTTTTSFPWDSPNHAYWTTGTAASEFKGNVSQVTFDNSGNLCLKKKDGSSIHVLRSSGASTEYFYLRAVLEYDGVFRLYQRPKRARSSSADWQITWSTSSYVPPNICTAVTLDPGSGACGFNSYCRIGDDERPSCNCPQGYTFLDPNDFMKGCRPSFVPQTCENASLASETSYLEEMPDTDWPLSDYEHFNPVSEDWCRQACLSDCFCAIAIFRNLECWKKKTPLSNGRMDSSVGGKALIKIEKPSSNFNPDGGNPKKISASVIISSIVLISSILLNLVFLVPSSYKVFLSNNWRSRTAKAHQVTQGINLRCFTCSELERATDGFKEEVGRGAFSTVYKGVVAFEKETFVAVKVLGNIMGGSEQEFETEVTAIGRTNHRNLVQLLGFCSEGQHRLLVYEYMRNGSLADFLFKSPRPGWYSRMQIAFGTARGLAYLHEECSVHIIHCDIKPQNILLDDTCTAKISDFGLAKLLKANQTRTSTRIRGTRGYVAPEWFKNLPVTVKVDVYSFGILLLELICCRKNFEPNVEDENQMILSDWAYDCFQEESLRLLVKNDEEAMHDMKSVKRFVMIAIWCIQEDPLLRPTMKKVSQMLEGAVEVSIPSDPSPFAGSFLSN